MEGIMVVNMLEVSKNKYVFYNYSINSQPFIHRFGFQWCHVTV